MINLLKINYNKERRQIMDYEPFFVDLKHIEAKNETIKLFETRQEVKSYQEYLK